MNKTTYTFIFVGVISLYAIALISYFIMNFSKPEKIVKRIVEQEISKKKEEIEDTNIKFKIINNLRNQIYKPEQVEKLEQVEKSISSENNSWNSWSYYLTDIDIEKIKKSDYDVVVLETFKGKIQFDENIIDSLKNKKNNAIRKILAYAPLGQAESYRNYWKPEWNKNKPSWMGEKSNVWNGVYEIKNVLDEEWLAISYKMIDDYIENSYDGMMVSGLGFYKDKKDAALFIKTISTYAKNRSKNFKIFVQDAEELVSYKNFVDHVDGVVRQSLYYEMLSGKRRSSSYVERTTKLLKELDDKGKLVFIVEYIDKKEWNKIKKTIEDNGFIGFYSSLKLNKI